MAKFHIVAIRPPNFLHTSGFNEIIDSLSWALSSLNHQVSICENMFSQYDMNIIFGAELFSRDQEIPKNCLIYNLEQPGHKNFPNIQRLAKDHVVWDYNKRNAEEWTRLGYNARHVPFGFTPNLVRIPKAANQDIDVFFSGWITPRRKKILDELGRTLEVVVVDSCYGGGRDNLISRSKVCLNIMHDGRNLTNIQRLSFWMANRKCIVSEVSSDQEDYADLFAVGISSAKYEDLVERCKAMVELESARLLGEQWAFEVFSKSDYVATVAAALESIPKVNPIETRYERGCREGDMKEYLPWLRTNMRGRVLEIGVRDGASTAAILLGLDANGGHLHSIDKVDCSQLWSHPRWTFECGDSKSAMFPDNEFDAALIDGDHTRSGFLADLHNCFHWVKNGGIIACHDVSPSITFEEHGAEYPSIAVGEEFKKFCKEKALTNFYLPGENGMGVLVVKK